MTLKIKLWRWSLEDGQTLHVMSVCCLSTEQQKARHNDLLTFVFDLQTSEVEAKSQDSLVVSIKTYLNICFEKG